MLTGVVLAMALHADWHLARPQHQHGFTLNPGFNWPYHWIATAAIFAVVGWVIGRRWTEQRWRIATTSIVLGIVLSQMIGPVLEALVFERRLGYHVEPARWIAFWQALAASVPAYGGAVWLGARTRSSHVTKLPDGRFTS